MSNEAARGGDGDISSFEQQREANRRAGGALTELTIRTHVPSKWRFVDLETGDVWRYNDEDPHSTFISADDIEVIRR